MKNNLVLNFDDLVNLIELEINDDNFYLGDFRYFISFEVFEYKREIEISNVKKSLYFFIVFRLKKVEIRKCVS